MRTFVLILLFITVPLAGGTLKPEQESDYWKDTGLDLAFARQMITNDKCSATEQVFHACRKAMIEGARLSGLSKKDSRFKTLVHQQYRKDFEFDSLLEAIVNTKAKISTEMLVGKVVNAYLRALDPYARLIPTAFAELLLNGASKTYYGLGIETQETGAGLLVFQVYPNTPASKADLKIHDRIVSVNGLSARNELEAHALAQGLVGRAGEKFLLEIERRGRKKTVTLEVAALVIPETSENIYSFNGKNIAYIRLRSFSQDTCLHLQEKLQAWQSQNVSGLVLDLRHNMGGLMDEGQCVAQLFVGNKPIVTREPLQLGFPESLQFEKAKLQDNTKFYNWRETFSDLPLVVLINERSASASEVVAGALQDYERAWIVGERSYGKGTTQLIHHLKNYSTLRVLRTVSHYLRPSSISTQQTGVTPNFTRPFNRSAQAEARIFLREEDMQKGMRIALGKKWRETRLSKVEAIDKCMGRQSGDASTDFQLSTAVHVFACNP